MTERDGYVETSCVGGSVGDSVKNSVVVMNEKVNNLSLKRQLRESSEMIESLQNKLNNMAKEKEATISVFDHDSNIHDIKRALGYRILSTASPFNHMKSKLGVTRSVTNASPLHLKTRNKGIKDYIHVGNNKRVNLLQPLSRTRRMVTMICKDAASLLDPPIVDNTGSYSTIYDNNKSTSEIILDGRSEVDIRNHDFSRSKVHSAPPNHPASLSPLEACQDTCLKLLKMIKRFTICNGCAILLRDVNASVFNSLMKKTVQYQVIYTGKGLSWQGLTENQFGVITINDIDNISDNRYSNDKLVSIVESCMRIEKSTVVSDTASDTRYNNDIDGNVMPNTPLLAVPIHGRSGLGKSRIDRVDYSLINV